MNDITDDDKLWAALSWVFWPIAIVMLLMEEKKNRPFIKYHAVNSLAFGIAIFVIIFVLASCTFFIGGAGGCLGLLLMLVMFYWAYKAYQGEWVEVPWLSGFIKGQGWT